MIVYFHTLINQLFYMGTIFMLPKTKKPATMPFMPWLRVGFLLFVFSISSGYRFRCYMFCKDQTAVQSDYIEQRDRCRSYAELKLDMAIRDVQGPPGKKTRKTKLINLFNQCMSENGWNIAPEVPKDLPAPVQNQPAVPQVQQQAEQVADAYEEKAALSRSAECMFARHAAAVSSISATRAQACDLECSQRLQAAPDAPRPAACPSDVEPSVEFIHGGEKTF